MKFMKKLLNGEWIVIDTETLLSEVPDYQIEVMIWTTKIVQVGSYQYRRYIPAVIRDWAIINS